MEGVSAVLRLLCCAVLCCAICSVLYSTPNIALGGLYFTLLYSNELLVLDQTAGLLKLLSWVVVVSTLFKFVHVVLQVEDLKRFMPQIIHIVQPGSQPAAAANKNVGSAGALTDIFSFAG